MTASHWFAYCSAIFAAGIIPGPVTMLALAIGAKQGLRSALPAALGNVLASVVQVLVSVTLYEAISRHSEGLTRTVSGMGGVYLIYLAFRLYQQNPFSELSPGERDAGQRGPSDFLDMFFLTLMNPKALIFFAALFPLVLPDSGYTTWLVGTMTLSFAVIAFACFTIYAMFGVWIRGRVIHHGLTDLLNNAVAIAFALFGAAAVYNCLVR